MALAIRFFLGTNPFPVAAAAGLCASMMNIGTAMIFRTVAHA
ncbi:hypothetical protein C4K35_5055 [Pseudomonas chlororaphis subsp. piscium]|nr:hypothetical protein C4K36_4980 [Pseudomonas chlororaphis subsp. piscium]AZC52616.1 hypothetical protein C4K35_5055 [Pseudomonas chlororaphis subsp. piscium]